MGLRLLEQNFRAAQIPGYAVGLRDHDASVHNIWVAYYAGRLGETPAFF